MFVGTPIVLLREKGGAKTGGQMGMRGKGADTEVCSDAAATAIGTGSNRHASSGTLLTLRLYTYVQVLPFFGLLKHFACHKEARSHEPFWSTGAPWRAVCRMGTQARTNQPIEQTLLLSANHPSYPPNMTTSILSPSRSTHPTRVTFDTLTWGPDF